MKNLKNKKILIIALIAVFLIAISFGITYAYWVLTKSQTNNNIVSTACLDIEIINEQNEISLTNQFPTTDEEGMELTPYTFTVRNKCNVALDYQIALESIGNSANAISTTALKAALDNNSPKLISEYTSVDPTIQNAYSANKLFVGTLKATGNTGSSVTHNLRIWIDINPSGNIMNRTYNSKISVSVGHGVEIYARLPLEYQEVEYIESTGSQYIDLGPITRKGSFTYEIKGQFTSVSEEGCLLGGPSGGFELFSSPSRNGMLSLYQTGQTTDTSQSTVSATSLFVAKVSSELNTNNFVVNDINYTKPLRKVADENIKIFSYNGSQYFSKAKVYSLKFSSENTNYLDLVPCYRKSDNVIGMYDLINNNFFINSGSGEFLKGYNVVY